MELVQPKIDGAQIEVLRKNTLAALTGGTGRANPETLAALERALDQVVASADPVGGFRYSKVMDVTPAEVATPFGPIESAKFSLMARLCDGEARVVFTLSTVGEALDELLARKAPLLDRFVMDAVASELAEIVAGLVEETWMAAAKADGRQASMRMSPGYCDWQIRGQSVLFRALDAGALGVRLTDSFLMIPSKSVSSAAVTAGAVPLKIQCLACNRKDCPFRRASSSEKWLEQLAQ